MGIEFRESLYVINAKNTRKLEPGMVINLAVGLQNLELANASDPKLSPLVLLYSIIIVIKITGTNYSWMN
jgi:nucleosome binding factor SPN SPT16 subunit